MGSPLGAMKNMPLPTPTKTQNKDEFIQAFMSSEPMQKEYPDEKQRLAVAYSQWRKNTSMKENLYSRVHGFEVKAIEDNDVVYGFIATSHLDQGIYSEELGKQVRDKVPVDALYHWAEELNSGNPRSNKVTIRHDRDDPVVAGVAVKGTAEVIALPDGEYGLYVGTVLDKTHPTHEATKNRIDIGTYDSFSIEFQAGESTSMADAGEYYVRTLGADSQLYGYTLASRPMNEYAVLIKEIMSNHTVSGKGSPQTQPPQNTETHEQPKVKEMENPDAIQISKEDHALLLKMKEMQATEQKEKDRAALKDALMKEMSESLAKLKPEPKTMMNKPSIECKEYVALKEAIESKATLMADGSIQTKVSVDEMFKRAGRFAESAGLISKEKGIKMDNSAAEYREYKQFSTNGRMLEFKGLGITTNQNSDTDYLLSAAELRDVFDPVIYTALNLETTAFNLMRKEDFSMKGNNLVQFEIETAANATAGFYAGDDVNTSNSTLLKLQTKFKKAQAGVMVSGDMIAAARGGYISDVFSFHVQRATLNLAKILNQALFSTSSNGAETDAAFIGFEYICNSASHTTLYSMTRSSTTLSANVALNPSSASDTYINGASADLTLAQLRQMKRQAVVNGANLSNLVFITSYVQGDKLRGIYDASQRVTPTSSRFGFEGRPEFDGIPMFEDADCPDATLYCIDLETFKVAIWVPPTLEMLGKDADNVKGFIKTYLATYCTNIRRQSMIYSLATS